MGLDIYVKWDGMTKEEEQAQITGYQDAPQAGYLRASWPSYGFLTDVSSKMEVVLPLAGYHVYGDGGNSGEIAVTEEVLTQLCEWRDHWLAACNLPVPTSEEGGEDFFRRKLRNSAAMVDFVEAKHKEGKAGLIIGYW